MISYRPSLRGASLLLAIAFLAAPLAGCMDAASLVPARVDAAATATAPPMRVVSDAAGDAAAWDARSAGQLAVGKACGAAGTIAAAACLPLRDAAGAATPPVAALAGPEGLDVVGLAFGETSTHLVVELEVVRLDADFSGVVAPDEDDAAWYGVCWDTLGVACNEYAQLVVRNHGGRVRADAVYAVTARAPPSDANPEGKPCSSVGFCAWEVDADVEPGAPGRIRWHVPRALLSAGDAGDVLTGADAATGRVGQFAPVGLRYRLHDPLPEPTRGWANAWWGYTVDATDPGEPFSFRSSAAGDVPVGPLHQPRPKADIREPARSDLDIVALGFEETPETLVVGVQLAAVEASPRPHEVGLLLALPESGVDWAGTWVIGDERGHDARRGDAPVGVRLEVEEGTPGWLRFVFDRRDLAPVAPGDVVAAGVYTLDLEGFRHHTVETSVDLRLDVDLWGESAWLRPVRIGLPTSAGAAAAGVAFEDDRGDARLPDDALGGGRAAPYDVTYLRIAGTAPGMSRLTLGIEDLSEIVVPVGYDGVLYAAAVEVDGALWMVGYHHDRNGAAEFFCAPDTTVFPSEKRDPLRVVRQAIQGVTSAAGRGDGGGGSGYVVFHVPHACFGLYDDAAVDAGLAAAGVYLIRRPPAGDPQIRVLDELEGGVATLGAAVASRAPSWYDAPFGVEAFWDIVGVLGAVAVAGAGAAALQRKRGTLRRYLREVERAAALGDPSRREAALRALRERLHDDLVRARISEGHYVIAERRLDHALAEARFDLFGESFRELPYGLVERLKRMLADGTVSPDDYEVFDALLERAAVAAPVKSRVRAKLQAWVAEDVGRAEDVAPDHVRVRP